MQVTTKAEFDRLQMLGNAVILKPGIGIKLPQYTPGFIVQGDPESGYASIYIPWAGATIPNVPYDPNLARTDTCWCYKVDIQLQSTSPQVAEKVG